MLEEIVVPKGPKKGLRRPVRRRAWIGDAVLSLYLRIELCNRFADRIPLTGGYFISNFMLREFSHKHATTFEANIGQLWIEGKTEEIKEIVKNLVNFGLNKYSNHENHTQTSAPEVVEQISI